MDERTERLYSSTPLEKYDLGQRLEKKLNVVSSFNIHISYNKEMSTYFKDENYKSKKNQKNETITTIIRIFDAIVIVATTSGSITLSLSGIGLIVLPISSGILCGLTISNKILYQKVMQKYNRYKKQYEKDQQSIKSFDKLYRKSLQENVINKNEYECLCNVSAKYLEESKNEPLL